MTTECLREQDVVDAIATGRWPARCDAELRSHVEGCGICQDVATVFAAIAPERDLAWEAGAVPPAALVWWRAQMRAREEAARAAGRPIAFVQGVTAVCLVVAALALTPFAVHGFRLTAAAVVDLAAWAGPRAAAVSSAFTLVTGTAVPLLPFIASGILIAPIVLYLALREE
jgi:hypothetical protein